MDLYSMMVAELVSKLVLCAVFLHVYLEQRVRYVAAWGIAWFLSAVFGIVLLTFPAQAVGFIAPVASLLGVLQLGACVAFLWGTARMTERPIHRAWGLLCAMALLWIAAGPFITSGPPLIIPVVALFGFSLIQCGYTVIRRSGVSGWQAYLAGGGLILWGVHCLDFPFLVTVEWFAPFGFLLSFGLQLASAMGLILVYLKRVNSALRLREQDLAEAKKLELVGRLAGGVAHDFNNVLMAIHGNLDLLRSHPGDTALLDQASEAADRAAALTRQLLGISRRQFSNPVRTDLRGLLSDAQRLFSLLAGHRLRLEIVAEESIYADVDRVQVEQILLNLVVNARDATEGLGTLTIRLERYEGKVEHLPHLSEGEYAMISVQDDGPGVPTELAEQIFRPFVSGKPDGQGTGLGLSTAETLARSLGGGVRLVQGREPGARFEIFFPAKAPNPSSAKQTGPRDAFAADASAVHPRSKPQVVVVDDDDAVRGVMETILSSAGYTVQTAASVRDARQLDLSGVSALVVDVLLADESGVHLAQELTSTAPGIGVVLCSGFTDGELLTLPPNMEFLEKPFSGEQLSAAVARATTANESRDGRQAS